MKLPTKVLCALAVAALAVPALAEDLNPPWWRGEISTTSQVWEFNQDVFPGTEVRPDYSPGQPFLASTHLIWEPGPTPWNLWMDEDRPFQDPTGKVIGLGVVPLSGWLDVVVDNHDPKPENKKWIRVQLTWRPQDLGEVPIFEGLDPQPVEAPRIVNEIPLGPDWVHTTYEWELDWNPPDERFTISGTINVDELVIDTWCVPEPATLGLLALGGLALIRRRKS